MKKTWNGFVGLTVFALLFALPGVGASAESVPQSTAVRVMESSLDRVLLKLTAPAVGKLHAVQIGVPYHTLELPGFGHHGAPGAPELPLKGFLVGVPPGADVELRVVGASEAPLRGDYRIQPSPTTRVGPTSPDGWASPTVTKDLPVTTEIVEDPAIYGVDAHYPQSPVGLVEIGYVRDQRIAHLEFFPTRTNPVSGELLYSDEVLVELVFSYPNGRPSAGRFAARDESQPFERLLREALVNYESAAHWRQVSPQAKAKLWSAGSLDPGYKISVSQTGIYELSYFDLQSAGLPVDELDPRTFQMYYQDQEIAIYVAGEQDEQFNPADYLLFYGEAISGKFAKYTTENVYWLTYDQEDGRRMAEKDGSPGTGTVPGSFEDVLHFEEDVHYWAYMPDHDDEDDFARWRWSSVWVADPAGSSQSHSVFLPGVAEDPVSASIAVAMYGYSDLAPNPDHHTAVYVNENWVGEFEWDGISAYYAQFDFPQDYLQEGNNDIRFEALLQPGVAGDWNLLDWFDIRYHRTYEAVGDVLAAGVDGAGTYEFHVDGFTSPMTETFDVTEPISVARFINTGGEPSASGYMLHFGDDATGDTQYWAQTLGQRMTPDAIELDVPSNWWSTANRADYIMITYDDFYDDILLLADFYTSTLGYDVAVVKLQDVFDEFSGGVFYPGAVRAFLSYAFDNWVAPAPTYVLLVGDGHYDFLFHYWISDNGQFFPPYLAYVDPWWGEVATDNRYVSISGNDSWPDMIVGRFPVNSQLEAQTMVEKSVSYQMGTTPEDWHQSTLFVTDNPDGGGSFHNLSDDIVDNYVPPPYQAQVEKVYFGAPPYTDPADATAAIKAAISDGQLFVSYIGHAAISWWANEKLLQHTDVPGLTNTGKCPVMLPMTCTDGHFNQPFSSDPSLSEVLVRVADKGAVASWAPTGLGVAAGHDYLEKGFLEAVFYNGVRRLGDAALAGKLNLWQNAGGSYRDLIETYGVLGDPALHINALDADLQVGKIVEPSGQLVPGDVLTYTLTFTNTGPAMVHHVTLSDTVYGEATTGMVPFPLVDATVVYSSPTVMTETMVSGSAGITFTWVISDLLPDASGEIQIRGVVSPTAALGFVIVDEAEISASTPDTDPSNNAVSVTTGIQVPDMTILKTGPESISYGQNITYTIAWGNQGEAAAPGARLTDTLPTWVSYVADDSGFTLTEPQPGTLVWQITPDPVPTDTGGTFILTGWVSMDPYMVGPLVNQSSIASGLPDGDPANSYSEWSTDLLLPDMGVQVDGPAEAAVLTDIQYTIAYSSHGDFAAHQAVITNVLPAGVTYLSDNSGFAHSEPVPGTHVWQVTPAFLQPGEGGSFVISASVGDYGDVGTVLQNDVEVWASTPDGEWTDNSDQLLTQVMLPDPSIRLEGPDVAMVGSIIAYTVVYSNAGTGEARGVVLADELPAGVSYISDDSGLAHTQPVTGTHVWDVGTLLAGEGGSFSLVAQLGTLAETGLTVTNSINIASDTPDSVTANNMSAWPVALRYPTYFPRVGRALP
jgi:uncharacterized repeat protein (TIGR01451 family)